MTREEKENLLTDFVSGVLNHLLGHSSDWPEDWDGFELRWLAQEAFNYEAPQHTRASGRAKRYKEFENTLITTNLY
jgi:hypothetical protein